MQKSKYMSFPAESKVQLICFLPAIFLPPLMPTMVLGDLKVSMHQKQESEKQGEIIGLEKILPQT